MGVKEEEKEDDGSTCRRRWWGERKRRAGGARRGGGEQARGSGSIGAPWLQSLCKTSQALQHQVPTELTLVCVRQPAGVPDLENVRTWDFIGYLGINVIIYYIDEFAHRSCYTVWVYR